MTQKAKKLDYWIQRQTIDMYRQMDESELEAAEVAKVYGKASGYISNKIEDIYERYRTKHDLTDAEAKRLIASLQTPEDIEEALRELKNGKYSTNKEDVLAKIESQSYGNRIERLQQLHNEIDLAMQSVYDQERIHTTKFYKDLANEAYYKSMYNIQQQANAAFGFSKLDPRVVEKVLRANWAGKSYSQRIWGNTRSLAQTLKRELLVSLLTGKTNFEVQKVIENKFLSGASKARRLIRTESNYISGEMNFLAYEDAGLKKYRFVATLDLRTSKLCRKLDNKVFLVKNRKVGVNCHPMHPWCRSTTVAFINDYALHRMERSARDPITGRTIRVPADMTYEQWYRKYVEGNPDAKAAEKKIANKSADGEQYAKYKNIYPEELKTFADFQKIKYNNSDRWEELKAEKQDAINSLDRESLKGLHGKLGNLEVRQWYRHVNGKIPDSLDKNQTLENQAKEAYSNRHENMLFARKLMADIKERDRLYAEDKYSNSRTFETLLSHKMRNKGMSYEEALRDIIGTSIKTNAAVDASLGLE